MVIQSTPVKLPDVITDIPGDKSISHRAIIISSLTKGQSQWIGFLCSDDCLHTIEVFKAMGVSIDRDGHHVTVNGCGVNGLQVPKNDLYVGNSGTGIRLIMGVLSALPFDSMITGDDSIQGRPMARVTDPLCQMGAVIETNNGCPPIRIQGGKFLHGITYSMPIASAQVKSALLLAGVCAEQFVTVTSPEPCRDHTERMLDLYGAGLNINGSSVSLTSFALYPPQGPIQIPADVSSALFVICYAVLTKQAVRINNVGLNESRIGCLTVLLSMGVDFEIVHLSSSYEPMGDIVVKVSEQPLHNVTVPLELVPNIIDECPILAVLAVGCNGAFSVRGAKELRVKESDRIDGICRLMAAVGVSFVEYDDGFDIMGGDPTESSFNYDAHFDHRLAMSAIIFSKANNLTADIVGVDSISTSFPNFFDMFNI